MSGLGLTPQQHREVGETVRKVMGNTKGYPYRRKKHFLGGGTSAYPCITTGAWSGGVVPVDVYKSGLDQSKTGIGEINVMQLHISTEIPVGTKLIAFESTIVNYNDEE